MLIHTPDRLKEADKSLDPSPSDWVLLTDLESVTGRMHGTLAMFSMLLTTISEAYYGHHSQTITDALVEFEAHLKRRAEELSKCTDALFERHRENRGLSLPTYFVPNEKETTIRWKKKAAKKSPVAKKARKK